MRGDYGEGNPWQMPMGQALEPVLKAMGLVIYKATHADEVSDAAQAALTMAFKGQCPVALLLTQQLIGAKAF